MRSFKALDIANLYIDLANSIPGDYIDNLKLNKICYYAQAWCCVKLGHPLFDDEIQAWDYGPLIPDVYHTYKICGDCRIAEPSYHVDESLLTSDELTLITDVYLTYGKYTSVALMNKTHEPGSPWAAVYENRANNPIPLDLMKNYFENSNELEVMVPNLKPDKVVSYA